MLVGTKSAGLQKKVFAIFSFFIANKIRIEQSGFQVMKTSKLIFLVDWWIMMTGRFSQEFLLSYMVIMAHIWLIGFPASIRHNCLVLTPDFGIQVLRHSMLLHAGAFLPTLYPRQYSMLFVQGVVVHGLSQSGHQQCSGLGCFPMGVLICGLISKFWFCIKMIWWFALAKVALIHSVASQIHMSRISNWISSLRMNEPVRL